MRRQAFVVKAVEATLLLALATASVGCSEPDNRVSRSTGDGEFELVLQAERNWVVSLPSPPPGSRSGDYQRPDGALPVRVIVRSLAGPLQDGIVDQVTFVVNNGEVSPRSLTATIPGVDDVDEAETEYSEWVIFTAARGLTAEHQGEINAIFRDALATLKIRVVPDPDSL